MNKLHLLDPLDAMKGMVLGFIAPLHGDNHPIYCAPLVTDKDWNDAEKALYSKIVGIPPERTCWAPDGIKTLPRSRLAQDADRRKKYFGALGKLHASALFLDPDTGFEVTSTSKTCSNRLITVNELKVLLTTKDRVLIVYRHQYWPVNESDEEDAEMRSYVRHSLENLRKNKIRAFAYKCPSASLFFMANQCEPLIPYKRQLLEVMNGVSADIINRRIVELPNE